MSAPMHKMPLGRTGFEISGLSFGCGAVGGLMVRGEAAARERAVARALEAGINYFDTAASYGDGASETHLGGIWKTLRPTAAVGSKFALAEGGMAAGGVAPQSVSGEIERSLDASLARLAMPSVDLFQLHNPIGATGNGRMLAADFVISYVVPALQRLQDRGKVRWIGFTGIGETAALLDVIEAGGFDAVQVVCNPLNPTAAFPAPPGFVGQDYRCLARRAAERSVGTLGIRILAGGAMAGTDDRHPVASPAPDPIGSGASYADDVAQARALRPVLVRHADSPVEAAVRFAAHGPPPDSAIVGLSSLDHLDRAIEAVGRGPLPPDGIDGIVGASRS